MKTTKNTVLITGGSAGIGLSIAKAFVAKGNEVIITGRDEERLGDAAATLGGKVTTIVGDVSKPEDVDRLVARVQKDFPHLNILINNAGKADLYDKELQRGAEQASAEMLVNYVSVIGLTERLLPLLRQQPEAAVVNVTSVLALVPSIAVTTYSATKAALRSYTQALRLLLQKTSVKVFELLPPLVNTELSKGIGGEKGISPDVVADQLLDSLAKDVFEVRVGQTEDIYRLHLASPEQALLAINGARL